MSTHNDRPTLKVLAQDRPKGDDWDEETSPDAPNAVTNRVLLKSLQRLERTVARGFRWMALSIGSLALVMFLWMWMHG